MNAVNTSSLRSRLIGDPKDSESTSLDEGGLNPNGHFAGTRPVVLFVCVLFMLSMASCGRSLAAETRLNYTQNVGIPTIPTFDGCAPNPSEPISAVPGLPVFAISAVVNPTQAKSASQVPGLLAIYDGHCVIFVEQQGSTMKIGFRPGANSLVIREIAGYLRSTRDFTRVIVTS